MNRRTLFLLFILFAVAAIVGPGCVRKASGDKDTREVVYHPRTGAVIYERETGEHLKQETPADTSGPSDLMFEDTETPTGAVADGGGISTAGSYEKPLEAYLGEQRQKIFYSAGVILIVAGVCVGILLNRFAGVGIGLAGFGVCFMPDILRTAGGPVGIIVACVAAIALIGGVFWAAASLYRSHRENVSGVASALKLAKLGTEGATREAVAALRETPIARTVKKGKS